MKNNLTYWNQKWKYDCILGHVVKCKKKTYSVCKKNAHEWLSARVPQGRLSAGPAGGLQTGRTLRHRGRGLPMPTPPPLQDPIDRWLTSKDKWVLWSWFAAWGAHEQYVMHTCAQCNASTAHTSGQMHTQFIYLGREMHVQADLDLDRVTTQLWIRLFTPCVR